MSVGRMNFVYLWSTVLWLWWDVKVFSRKKKLKMVAALKPLFVDQTGPLSMGGELLLFGFLKSLNFLVSLGNRPRLTQIVQNVGLIESV